MTTNSYIRVNDGEVVSGEFGLPRNYQKPDGGIVSNVSGLTDEQKAAIGLYRVVENVPFDSKIHSGTHYTVNDTTVSATRIDKTLAELKEDKIAKVYEAAADILQNQCKGYCVAEIAAWAQLRRETRQYNIDGTVGVEMQAVIDQGLHTAATLAAMLAPKVNTYDAALARRAELVTLINAAANKPVLAEIDITTGWPE